MQPRRYGPFAYVPMPRRPKLHWPNNARLAFWIIPNIEFFGLDEQVPPQAGGGGKTPDVPTWAARDYGNRVGVFRLMDVMDRYGMRGSVALNSNLCAEHPEIIEEGMKRNWEWMGHNQTNTKRLNQIPPEEEHGVIKATLDTIEAATGKRPAGWLSSGLQQTWNSLDYLAAEGVRYVCDWVNDDQPYPMTLDNGGSILSVPYSTQLNDKPAFEHSHMTADQFETMIKAQFDVLWREGAESGRVMAIALHPYIIGQPHRIGALDRALAYICGHQGVWRTTGSEIADHYAATTLATAHAAE